MSNPDIKKRNESLVKTSGRGLNKVILINDDFTRRIVVVILKGRVPHERGASL